MIDFHTHILPGIDDGSRDIAMTERLLEQEKEQGVTTVVATPHFYADQMSFDHFLTRRKRAAAKTYELCRRRAEAGSALPKVLLAAEVYYFPGISKADRLPELCLEGTNILLLEMPFAQWTEDVYKEVRKIALRRRLQVVLVHIERFYPFQKDRQWLEQILELPVILQINAGAFTKWGERRILKKILQTGKPVILGSDCHSPDRRPVTMADGCSLLDKKIGPGTGDQMNREAEKLLSSYDLNSIRAGEWHA